MLVVVTTVAVAVAVVTVLGARTGGDNANGSVPVGSLTEIAGTWNAVNDTGAPAKLGAPVRLLVAEGGMFVDTGCNTGRGLADVQGSRLVVGALATTKRACPPPLGAQEHWVREMLTTQPRLERSGPMLALHWGEEERYWLGLELVPEPTTSTGTAPTV